VLLDSVIQPVIQPVLEQPLVATAVDLLTDADDDITAVLTGSAALSDTRTGASAPAMMRVAPIGHATAGTAVAVPGESHAVGDLVPPVTPTAPTSFDATAPAQNSAGHPLAAAIFDFNRATALSAATTSLQNDALPSSATFDTDCSPD
jgi:hypothetical protein